MNTTTALDLPGVPHSPLRSYALEAWYEWRRLLRTPSYVIPTLLFPALFYVLFGLVLNKGRGDAAQYLLATYGVFGAMGAGLFGFGVTVAIEREQGLLTYKRALPMPPGAYLVAKMVTAVLFASAIFALLAVLAASFGGVSLSVAQWLLLALVCALGVLPFCAIGLFIGTLVGGQGAPAVVNMLFLPMAFLSGLWLPLKLLPSWIAGMAPVWPAYHHAQIALKVIGLDGGGLLAVHIGVLIGITVLFAALARRRLAG
ncbi:ABC transporter permease [Lysobacter brunescens]|uniref:ABC transporter permease n=1 Tax=Lysobacter brunescens TaxID=262323 RepID=A0ABW2Y9T5_9GAMM